MYLLLSSSVARIEPEHRDFLIKGLVKYKHYPHTIAHMSEDIGILNIIELFVV